jgi:hypothetical protein
LAFAESEGPTRTSEMIVLGRSVLEKRNVLGRNVLGRRDVLERRNVLGRSVGV